jgi:hypothetical protein
LANRVWALGLASSTPMLLNANKVLPSNKNHIGLSAPISIFSPVLLLKYVMSG